MRIKKKNKGITLVALAVTIVVLLILSGVTITSIVGKDGIIGVAQNTAIKTNEAFQHQQGSINMLIDELENISDGWIVGEGEVGNIENTTEGESGENKDTTPPSVIINITSVTYNSITINVKASDGQSGLADSERYKYYLDNEAEPREISQDDTYTYTDLASGVIYNLKVVVKDKAGNETAKTISQQVNIVEEMPNKEIQVNIGKYVDYEPISTQFDSESSRNGYGYQNISTNMETKWRIFKIEEDTLTLISDKEANTKVYLGGANGYNNGVLLLNKMCERLYSNYEVGATARSINVDDVDEITGYTGYTQTVRTPNDRYYPAIAAKEKTVAVNGKYGTLYGESDQTEYITGSSRASSSLKGAGTIHEGNILEYNSGIEANMIAYGPDGTTELDYWLASRRFVTYYATSNPSDVTGHFQMLAISSGGYAVGFLYDTDDDPNDVQAGIRPLVEIDLTKAKVLKTGDGSRGKPYSISPK